MRKIIKKIATLVATVTMVSAMGISALADSTFSFMGNPNLFNEPDEGNTVVGWVPTNEDQLMTAVEGMDGVYSFTGTNCVAGDKEFKVLKDATDFAWNYQMCIGNPDAAWADNQSQFRGTFAEGEYKVYAKPAAGFVCVIQNKEAIPMTVRYKSRDEDSANFVDVTKAAIEADGYSDVPDFDADYAAFVSECIVAEGGTPKETEAAEETTTLANNDETTTVADDTKDETTKADASEDEDEGLSPVVIVVIVVAVVAVIAVIVALTKKKNN